MVIVQAYDLLVVARALRHPEDKSDLFCTARREAYEVICETIVAGSGLLRQRAVEIAEEQGYTVPVDLRGL